MNERISRVLEYGGQVQDKVTIRAITAWAQHWSYPLPSMHFTTNHNMLSFSVRRIQKNP